MDTVILDSILLNPELLKQFEEKLAAKKERDAENKEKQRQKECKIKFNELLKYHDTLYHYSDYASQLAFSSALFCEILLILKETNEPVTIYAIIEKINNKTYWAPYRKPKYTEIYYRLASLPDLIKRTDSLHCSNVCWCLTFDYKNV